jgi:hypothetical protein
LVLEERHFLALTALSALIALTALMLLKTRLAEEQRSLEEPARRQHWLK